MKKLIAMIGAVAMSFGLFADATPFFTSFDSGDAGVSGTEYTSSTAGWSGLTDPLTLKAYGTDDPAYDYTTTERREAFENANLQYLPLETERTATLNHEITEGNVFVDQLVRFTGFEDPQTNLVEGVKIAVWMGEFFNDEETAATTNLYVTVGSDNIEGQIAVRLAGTYEIGKWYRLTIKSLGDIFNAGEADPRAGFCIWIDGEKKAIASNDDHFDGLISHTDQLKDDTVKAAYAKHQLFPAVSSGSDQLALNSFGYNGIGAIDDVYVDDVGPDFTVEEYTFTIADDELGRVEVASVYAGTTKLEEPYTVAPGTDVTITWKAKKGYKFRDGAATQITTIKTPNQEVAVDETQVEILDVVATVTNDGNVEEFAEDELYDMINNLDDGDVVTFLDSVVIKEFEDDDDSLYEFSEDTTIEVKIANDITTWEIVSASAGDWIVDNVGVTENFIKAYTLADEESTVALGGNVAGEITASSIEVTAQIEVAGTLTAEALTIDETITLSGEGKVITEDGELIVFFDSDEGDPEVVPNTPEEGLFTYRIKHASDTFKVTVLPLTTGLTFVSMMNGDTAIDPPAAGDYMVNDGDTFTVEYAPAEGYKFTRDGETGVREATEEDIIDPPAVERITTGFAIIIAGDPAVTNYYPTLDKAIEEYTGAGVVALMADSQDLDHCIAIDKDVIFDLNGYTLAAVNGSSAAGVFAVRHGGFLTINDSSAGKTGAIDGSAVPTAIKMTQNATDTDDTKLAKLVVNGGTITGYNYGIGGNGNSGRGNTAVEINGGKITAVGVDAEGKADSCAIFNPQAGTLVINGGEIEAGMGIIIKSGSLTVNGGSIKATGEAAAWVKKTNGFSNTGDAIEVDNIGYPGESPVVEIKGGEIVSANNAAVASRYDGAYEQITGFVTGGEFTGNAPMDNALAGGSYAFPPFTPGEPQTLVDAVAKIGNVNYATLAAALDAAVEGDTVTLLADTTLDKYVLAKKVVLDLDGYDLSSSVPTGGYPVYASRQIIKLIDGADLTIDGEGSTVSGNIYIGVKGGTTSSLVLNGGTYVNDTNSLSELPEDEQATQACLQTVGTDKTGTKTIVLNGCTFTAPGAPIYLAGNAEAIFNNCTITGDQAVAMKGGSLTINGGTYTAIGAENIPTAGRSNGIESSGAAIQIESNSSYSDIAVEINDAIVVSQNGPAVYEYLGSTKTKATRVQDIALKGGSYTAGGSYDAIILSEAMEAVPGLVDGVRNTAVFSTDVSEYCEEGYETTWDEDTQSWGVKQIMLTASFYADTEKTDLVDEQIVAYGTAPTNVVVTKEGYTFTGWDPEISAITEDTDYVAQFEIQQFTLTLNNAADGSATIAADVASPVEYGTKVTITATAAEGYTYVAAPEGWTLSEGTLVKIIESMVKDETITAPAAGKNPAATCTDTTIPEGYDVAKRFVNTVNPAETYTADWAVNFYLSADKAIAANTIQLMGTKGYQVPESDVVVLPAIPANTAFPLVVTQDPIPYAALQYMQYFDCALKNLAVTEETTVTVALVISKGTENQVLASFNYTVEPKMVTATFIADGKTVDTQEILYGTAPEAPEDPVKEGHTFTGWDPEISEITEDTTYTAQFEEIVYNITIASTEHGKLETSVTNGVAPLTTVRVKATPDEGYQIDTIKAGNTDITYEKSFLMPYEDVTVTATFKLKDITITVNYDENIDALLINDIPRQDGEEIKLSADTTSVTYELKADEDAIKIPVFYQTIGGLKTKITANGSLAVSDGLEVTFSAKDAASEEVTDADARAALKEQGYWDSTLNKFAAPGAVKKFAAWVEKHPGTPGDTIGKSDYVQASVALDVDLITATTEIKITDLKEVTGGAMTFKVKIATTPMATEAQLDAIKDMVKATKDVTDWTTAEKQLEVAATADATAGTVTITPAGSPAAAFMRVVIPLD